VVGRNAVRRFVAAVDTRALRAARGVRKCAAAADAIAVRRTLRRIGVDQQGATGEREQVDGKRSDRWFQPMAAHLPPLFFSNALPTCSGALSALRARRPLGRGAAEQAMASLKMTPSRQWLQANNPSPPYLRANSASQIS